MGTQRIDIIINGKNSLSSALKNAATDVKKIGSDAKTAGTNLTKMGSDATTATNKLKTGLSGAKSKVGELKSSFSSLGGVITSALAGFTLSEMVQSAGDAESKWIRIGVQTGKTGAELAKLKTTVRDIANYYGVSNGELSRVYENAVRFYGASDDTLNKVKGIAATAKLTPEGIGVEEVYNAVISGELGRNRQLQKSILSEAQRTKYLADGKITQEEINQILAENQQLVEDNPDLVNDTNSAYTRMENSINKIKVSLGKGLLPVMEKLADWISWGADKFSELNEWSGGWASTIAAAGLALVALGAPLGIAYDFMSKLASPLSKMGGWIKDAVVKMWEYVAAEKAANSNKVTPGAASTTGVASTVGGFALGAGAVLALSYATVKIMQAQITTETLVRSESQYGPATATIATDLQTASYPDIFQDIVGAMFYGPGPISKQAEKEKMDALKPKMEANLKDWGPLQGVADFFGGLFSPVSAAGGGGNKGIMNDIFGKGGLMRGTPLEGFKWPSTQDILKGITDKLPKMPVIKWPTIGSIGKWIRDHIPKLNWKWPSLGSIGKYIRDHIPRLNWKWPTLGSISTWIQTKIPKIGWKIPTLGDIKKLISDKITSFSWPWGPSSAHGTIPRSQYREVRGPLSDTVTSTMSNRSGVGASYISRALAKRFSGVDAFGAIADGIAAPLGYEFYFGDQKSNQQVWDSKSCNCYDGAQFLISEAAQRFGLSTGMSHGVWDGTSIGHVWSNIGGREFDMAAKLLRGSWLHPSGPRSKSEEFRRFMDEIGPALEYVGYGGHGKDPISAVLGGGNCYDMTLGIMGLASGLFGLPSKMVWGTYGGGSHVWANIAGRNYDLSRRALENTYNPPPRGPSGPGGNTIVIQGDVYGFDDFQRRVEQANNRIVRGY